jgi:hypothetical protein
MCGKPSLIWLQFIRLSDNADRNMKNEKMLFTVLFSDVIDVIVSYETQ